MMKPLTIRRVYSSRGSLRNRFIMGLLRASADAIMVGARTVHDTGTQSSKLSPKSTTGNAMFQSIPGPFRDRAQAEDFGDAAAVELHGLSGHIKGSCNFF